MQPRSLAGPAAATLLAAGLGLILAARTKTPEPLMRLVEYTETVSLDPGGRSLRVWLPVPRSTQHQDVTLVDVRSPIKYRWTKDRDYGNRILFFESEASGPVTITARYRINRRERQGLNARTAAPLKDEERAFYTKARGLVVINDEVRAIAERAVGEQSDPLAVGRRLYDAVLDRMAYDKKAPGWGKGDTTRACEIGKGNCTDFHSLFMSLARSRKVPVRFIMGLPLKAAAEQELKRGYHCWAEFYADGKGWVPVDISEAWKDPRKKEYLFGNLDRNRIALTVGREIRLDPPQQGEPLNYFAYPQVEVGGKPYPIYRLKRVVRTLEGKDPGAASADNTVKNKGDKV